MALFERGSINLTRTLSSLRHRDFRLLFVGTSLSHVGDFIQVMAQSWLVWTMTSSPFLLGVVGFCQAVPRLLLGAIGGAVVDRMEPRRLLVSTRRHERLCVFVIFDCFFLLPFIAVINVAADPRWRQQYRDSRRGQFNHTTGNAAAFIRPHIEPVFYGQGFLVIRHLIHRQRRPFCRHPGGDCDFRSMLRHGRLVISLPAETGAESGAGRSGKSGKRAISTNEDKLDHN